VAQVLFYFQGDSSMNQHNGPNKRLFSLGQVVATPGAVEALTAAHVEPLTLLARHASGDWGELVEEDKQANEHAVQNELRILSSYRLSTGEKIWVITEWNRSVTTLLLPMEY
jgi:hypothetical protein